MSGNTWFDTRIVRHALGLLDDDEERRFLELLDTDEACREAWLERVEEDADREPGERHIPPAMIARWSDATMRLGGLERESIARHLERCETCRDDLETFGFEPRLVPTPETDLPSTAGIAGGAAMTAPTRPLGGDPIRAPREARERRRFFFWGALSGAGLAAAAASLLLLVRAPSPGDGALPWVAPSRVRGTAAVVTIEPQQKRIALMLGVPRGTDTKRPASIRVTGPRESPLMNAPVLPERLAAGTVVVVMDLPAGLASGTYHVLVEQTETGVREETTFVVAIRGR